MNIIIEGNSYLREIAKNYLKLNKKVLDNKISEELIQNNLRIIERSNQSVDASYFINLLDTISQTQDNTDFNNGFILDKSVFSVLVDEISNSYRHKISQKDIKLICKKIIDYNIPIIFLVSKINTNRSAFKKVSGKDYMIYYQNTLANNYRPVYNKKADLLINDNTKDEKDLLVDNYIEDELYRSISETVGSYFKIEKIIEEASVDENGKKKRPKKEKSDYKNIYIIEVDTSLKKLEEAVSENKITSYIETNNIDYEGIENQVFQELRNILENGEELKELENLKTNLTVNSPF